MTTTEHDHNHDTTSGYLAAEYLEDLTTLFRDSAEFEILIQTDLWQEILGELWGSHDQSDSDLSDTEFGEWEGDRPPDMDDGEPSVEESQIIAEVVGETEVGLLNLTEFTRPVTVDYAISREASPDNKVYFYRVDDLTGMVNGVVVRNHSYSQAVVD
ncbi:MAG: hypothetical protein AAFW75_24540 [Cyanobacteria bacterium J06636_16]